MKFFVCGETITIHFLASNSTKNHQKYVAQSIGSTRKQNILCNSIWEKNLATGYPKVMLLWVWL